MPTLDEHIAAICADAGLGVMVQVYEILADREEVPVSALMELSADDVEAHYFTFIGPAIDGIETRMLAREDDLRIIRKYGTEEN